MIDLPWPPTSNNMHAVYRGRKIASAKYRDWIENAGLRLLTQRPAKHEGPVAVSITLGPPDKRRFDIDNRIKAILDLLVRHQVIQRDDSEFVRAVTVKLGEGFVGARVSVEAA